LRSRWIRLAASSDSFDRRNGPQTSAGGKTWKEDADDLALRTRTVVRLLDASPIVFPVDPHTAAP